MRSGEPDVRLRDRRHPDEVVAPGHERSEGRREGHQPEHLHAHRGGDHLLLGDVHLEEAIGRGLLEVLRVRRVADLGVEHDDIGAGGAERLERFAVSLPRRQRLGVRLEIRFLRPGHRSGRPRVGLDRRERARRARAELREGLLRLLGVEGLPVPALLVLEERDALPLHGLGDDDRGPLRLPRLAERVVDRGEVVAIDDDRLAAERLHPRGVRVHVPFELGRASLAEAVDIEDRREVRKALVARMVEALPDRALGELAVARQGPHVEGRAQGPLRGQRLADRDGQTLAERAGGDVGPRQDRCGVAFEPAADLAERHELGVVDRAGRPEHRVVERRGVSLAEDQVVVRRSLRCGPVVPQMGHEQDRDEVGR